MDKVDVMQGHYRWEHKQRERNFKKEWKRSARSAELWQKWRMSLMDLLIALFSFIQELRDSYK